MGYGVQPADYGGQSSIMGIKVLKPNPITFEQNACKGCNTLIVGRDDKVDFQAVATPVSGEDIIVNGSFEDSEGFTGCIELAINWCASN